jgi:hypothetical protein
MLAQMPTLFAGELDCSRINIHDDRDANDFLQHMRTFSDDFGIEEGVEAVHLQSCNLTKMCDNAYKTLLGSLSKFKNLQRLRVNGCRLSAGRVVQLMLAVKDMDNFKKSKDESTMWSELAIGGNEIDDVAFHVIYKTVNVYLMGVGTLSLMHTDITDHSMLAISHMFPNVKKLFLSNTKVRGTGVATLTKNMRTLCLLALDNTLVDGQGCSSILEAMTARNDKKYIVRLEVWLRGVPDANDEWKMLFDWISTPRHLQNFHIKHDRLLMLGQRPCHVVQVHDTLWIALHISNVGKFAVRYLRVVCTKSIIDIAKEAICILNEIALTIGKDTSGSKSSQKKREQLWRDVLLEHSNNTDRIRGKSYKLGIVQLTRKNKFTGVSDMSYNVSHALLEVPRPSTECVIDVEAEEEDESALVRNSNGAFVGTKRPRVSG